MNVKLKFILVYLSLYASSYTIQAQNISMILYWTRL